VIIRFRGRISWNWSGTILAWLEPRGEILGLSLGTVWFLAWYQACPSVYFRWWLGYLASCLFLRGLDGEHELAGHLSMAQNVVGGAPSTRLAHAAPSWPITGGVAPGRLAIYWWPWSSYGICGWNSNSYFMLPWRYGLLWHCAFGFLNIICIEFVI